MLVRCLRCLLVVGVINLIAVVPGSSTGNGSLSTPWLSSYLVVAAQNNLAYSPAAAYNSQRDEFLVVWENVWPGGKHDIYGGRVSAAGQVLDLFTIASSTVNRMNPTAAYDSTHDTYLVTYALDYNGDGSDWDINARFIPGTGPTLDQPEFTIDNSRSQTGKPRVVYALAEDRFLVAWVLHNSDTDYAIQAAIVNDSRGAAALGSLSAGPEPRDFPDVTYNLARDEFIVAWDVENSATGLDTEAVRLSGSGTPLGSGVFTVAGTALNEQHPTAAACASADQYLFVWQNQSASSSADDNLYGRFMTGAGVLGPVVFIEGTTAPQQFPRLACGFTGKEYFLTWHDMYANPQYHWGIWAKTVRNDQSFAPAYEIVAPSEGYDRNYPAVAFGRFTALIAWQHMRDGTGYQDIWGRLIRPHVTFLPLLRK
jgi:hypothetical protein